MDARTLALCTGGSPVGAARYAKPLAAAMPRYGITTPERIAAFLGNVSVETMQLAAVEENLNYTTAERLRLIFPSLFVPAAGGKYKAEEFVRNPSRLSTVRYAGFHGRGLLHLTWQANYAAAGKALGFDYVKEPAKVMETWHAVETACWFWHSNGLNEKADKGDMHGCRLVVNGPKALGLVEAKQWRIASLKTLRDSGTALA